jgi:hypothetical protein
LYSLLALSVGQRKTLMTFVASHKEPSRVIGFLFSHKAELATGGLIVALLARPEEVMGGMAKVVTATGESMVAPIAENAVGPISNWVGFTFCSAVLIALCGWLIQVNRKTSSGNALSD